MARKSRQTYAGRRQASRAADAVLRQQAFPDPPEGFAYAVKSTGKYAVNMDGQYALKELSDA